MKLFILTLFLSPILAQADCPNPMNYMNGLYCAHIDWGVADRKIRGAFEETADLSPQLVLNGEVTQKWLYSKAKISIWQKGDPSRVPVKFNNLNIFPYMVMENGAHHSASYNFKETISGYEISEMAIQQMPGCWSLRWSFNANEEKKSSHLLTYIGSFVNLSAEANSEAVEVCLKLESNKHEDSNDSSKGGHKH